MSSATPMEIMQEFELLVEFTRTFLVSGHAQANGFAEVSLDGEQMTVADIDFKGSKFLITFAESEEEGAYLTIFSKKYTDLEISVPQPTSIQFKELSDNFNHSANFSEEWC